MMHRQGGSATDALQKQVSQHQTTGIQNNKEREKSDFFGSLLLCVCLTVLLRHYLTTGGTYRWIDHINLGIHEMGHVFFTVFGSTFLHVLGGTAGQLLMPTLFLGYIIYKRQYVFIPLILARYATNFFSIAIYMYDTTRGTLPMVSFTGDSATTIHDRQYLFGSLQLLHLTDSIAFRTKQIGGVLLCAGRGRSLLFIYKLFQRGIHHEK